MKVDRPQTSQPTAEETEDLLKYQHILERAVTDGRISRDEIALAQAAAMKDGKLSIAEVQLYREIVLDKIKKGELEYDFS